MKRLKYVRLLPSDVDIPFLLEIHSIPDISQFISIDTEKYFDYVTKTDSVFYYKVIFENEIVSGVHIEHVKSTLYISVLTIPQYQNHGFATQILEDIQSGGFIKEFKEILVSIDKSNFASIHLFEKTGFILCGEEDELLKYCWRVSNR